MCAAMKVFDTGHAGDRGVKTPVVVLPVVLPEVVPDTQLC